MPTKLLRFADLKAIGVANSYAQLKRMVELYGFPSGRLLSPNSRVWTDVEVDAYIATRPTEPKKLPEAARRPNSRQVAA